MHAPVLDHGRAQHDAGIHLAAGAEIADAAAIGATRVVLELVDDLHRPHLGRARDRAGQHVADQRAAAAIGHVHDIGAGRGVEARQPQRHADSEKHAGDEPDPARAALLARRGDQEPLRIVEEVSRALPPGQWVRRLEWNGRTLRLVEQTVGDQDWLMAAGFSGVDCAVGWSVWTARRFVPLSAALQGYVDRCADRAAFQASLPGAEDPVLYDRDFYEVPDA